MTRIVTRTAVIVVAGAVAFAGCAKKPAASSETGKARDSEPVATPAPGGEIQLAGNLGCGHCVFHVTSECAACVKTAAGDVYVIDGIDDKSGLWEKRLEEGHTIAVNGKVVGGDPKHIAMTSFDLK